MNPKQAAKLESLRTALQMAPEGYNQQQMEQPDASTKPCGCLASYLVASDRIAQGLWDGTIQPEEAAPGATAYDGEMTPAVGDILQAAAYALGLRHIPRLFNTEWPRHWYVRAGRPDPGKWLTQPDSEDASAVLTAIGDNRIEDALANTLT